MLMNQMRRTVVSEKRKLFYLVVRMSPSAHRKKTVFITCFPLFCYFLLLLDYIFVLPGACNFNMEDDRWEQICQLSQDPDDDFDWRIGHNTETGVGPQSDHSPGLHMY